MLGMISAAARTLSVLEGIKDGVQVGFLKKNKNHNSLFPLKTHFQAERQKQRAQ